MKAETVQVNDIDMYYEIEGEGDPLLLLHGGTGCQENWIHAGRDVFVREYIRLSSLTHAVTVERTTPKRRLHIGNAHWTRWASLIGSASKSAVPLD